MDRSTSRRFAAAAATGITLLASGCGNPYAVRTDLPDYDATEVPGSIRFTDPKLYRREALIEERRKELEYLDDLLASSKSVNFAPQMIRELQAITTFSAALGLSFDEGIAKDARRADEKAGIQQDIDVIKLQMQLDQLKRDAELFRQALATQTAPSAPPGTGGQPAQAPQPRDPASAAQLVKAIESLQASLATTLAAPSARVEPVGVAADPIDLFRDRETYRGVLKTARNAASLDELHDFDGAALMRLYFSATVLPPAKDHMDTLGLLRMEVERPSWTDRQREAMYLDWLAYVNRTMNLSTPGPGASRRFHENPAYAQMINTGELFDVAYYFFDQSGTHPECAALLPAPADMRVKNCSRLTLAVPKVKGPSVTGVQSAPMLEIYGHQADLLAFYKREFADARRKIDQSRAANGASPAVACIPAEALFGPESSEHGMTVEQSLQAATYYQFVLPQIGSLELNARNILASNGIDIDVRSVVAGHNQAIIPEARALTDAFSRKTGCPIDAKVGIEVPPPFRDVVDDGAQRVAIYEVGPRQQVQQLSTAARAAEAIGLAAAISGSVPTQGLGLDGNVAYARSATGRVDALERLPQVISFAEPDGGTGPGAPSPAFGWLLGPKATLDPEDKRIDLTQPLRVYDLSVDLSLPGWWPYVMLKTTTAWAPNWRSGDAGQIGTGTGAKRIKVALRPTSADYAALTAMLGGFSGIRIPRITAVKPEVIPACSGAISLQVTGDHIWRTTTALLGGSKLDANSIAILPDMNGVLLTIDSPVFPAVSIPKKGTATAQLSLLTPYGTAEHAITLNNADGACTNAGKGAKP